jgi:hypothetical protein
MADPILIASTHGGKRRNAGGKRANAGRKPSPKTLFDRDFVGPMPRKRRRHATEEDRQQARQERINKRLAALKSKRDAERAASGIEKFERTTRYQHVCSGCGVGFVAKLTLAKYCTAQCRIDAGNAAASARSLEKNRAPKICKGCGVSFCIISNDNRRMEYCDKACGDRSYDAKRLKTDHVFAVKKRVRSRLATAFRLGGYSKKSKTKEILGCTFEELVCHLEKQFRRGMSWSNRDQWHIDHIVPLASAESEEDIIKLNHFTNLQPLWAADNLAKSDKLAFLI